MAVIAGSERPPGGEPGDRAAAVELREVRDEDLPALFEHQADPESVRMADFPSRDREAFMAHWAKIRKDPSIVLRTVLWNGEVAGNALSFVLDGRRYVGYWIGREFWGRGIASRALGALLEVVAERPLYASVARHNARSIRVLEKHGFRPVSRDTDRPQDLTMILGGGGSRP